MIALRESPAPLGPGRIRPWTLVAMTTSSRRVSWLSARPTISSLEPSEYTLAVSKKVTPRSSAREKNGLLASSPRVQAWLPRSGSP